MYSSFLLETAWSLWKWKTYSTRPLVTIKTLPALASSKISGSSSSSVSDDITYSPIVSMKYSPPEVYISYMVFNAMIFIPTTPLIPNNLCVNGSYNTPNYRIILSYVRCGSIWELLSGEELYVHFRLETSFLLRPQEWPSPIFYVWPHWRWLTCLFLNFRVSSELVCFFMDVEMKYSNISLFYVNL